MTFWERFQDAVNSFFGHMDDSVHVWLMVAVWVLMVTLLFFVMIRQEQKDQEYETNPETGKIEIPNPVAIKRQPAEIFETDCDLCGCGYRYTVDYVKDFTTVCPHCGTKNPHGPADTDIISRRVPEE